MAAYALRRLLTTIPIVLFITIIAFTVMNVVPGDPALTLLGQEATPEAVEVLRERMGLNRPLHIQYLSWVSGLLQFDLGRSLIDGTPVARAVGQVLVVTLQVIVLIMLIVMMIVVDG